MEEQIVDELKWITARGKTLQVKRKNPYGLLNFSFKEGGQLPEELTGAYTSFQEVTAAAESYMSKQPVFSHDPKSPRPELKLKSDAKKQQPKSIQ